ncbi:MAG: HI0074 family nucleotidyltransferase substrate-binding subunit [Oscillospiraceae bacterium]|nr:nucleotidyltransferase substrate binding protein [Oscillospiraceae bacterium]MCI7499021.1 nucleotidyltransferase substrate binding protein [Oscillospiraceae bacterium]MDD7279823.1 HI0074 family nucleotidyltransferase substrate-binding subunit [Oscillospiraceae bacterium]MDY2864179.1 HI0074 family nucleotidyltransferase substrate-binding subunit [Oscillospiraceae bacterium]
MRKYENFCKALSNLHEGLKLNEPYSVVEQTGIVGLFEICFEQSWKLMKAVLEDHGRFEDQIGSPRAIIKIAYQCNMIKDGEKWLELLESRNILAHTYSDAEAVEIIRKLKNDYFGLFEELRDEIDDRWI